KWRVWDDHFQIYNIACSFAIRTPFNSPSVSVKLLGTLDIEGVPLNVFASNIEGFTVYAELAEKQTIPLKQLLQTYAPEVPAPSDLTVNSLRVSATPFKQYMMATTMAQGPDSWSLDVGPGKLKVSDASLIFSYPKGGRVNGTFGGSIAFGDIAKLSMRYDLPGNFVIRTLLPEVKLSQLVKTLSNQPVEMPGGFDLDFKN